MVKKIVHMHMRNEACTRFVLLFPRSFPTGQKLRALPVTPADSQQKGRLHEKSYPSNDQEQSLPPTRNAHESNGEQCSGPPMRGKKRGKIRPVGTISREVMRTPN